MAENKKPAGHRVTIIGKGTHKVGKKTLKRGEQYNMADLGLDEKATADLEKDAFVVIEPVDEKGNVIARKPGEVADEEDMAKPAEAVKK